MTDMAPDASAGVRSTPGSQRVRAWDPFVRAFHWTLVTLVLLNLFVLDPEGKLHRWAGYGVASLLAARLVWGVVGPRIARFSAFPPSMGGALGHMKALLAGRRETPHLSHNPLGALMVYNLLGALALVALTGWMMTLNAFWGVEWVEEVHEVVANWVMISALLHVAGVAVESRRSGVNLVGAMVTGWKRMPGRSD